LRQGGKKGLQTNLADKYSGGGGKNRSSKSKREGTQEDGVKKSFATAYVRKGEVKPTLSDRADRAKGFGEGHSIIPEDRKGRLGGKTTPCLRGKRIG